MGSAAQSASLIAVARKGQGEHEVARTASSRIRNVAECLLFRVHSGHRIACVWA